MSESFIEHVIHGESDNEGRGGHLFGTGREGKTEFPASWDRTAIIQAMNLLLERPEYIHYVGRVVFLRKHIRGVLIEFKLVKAKDSLIAVACFPVSGEGVVLNVAGSQVSLEISQKKEGY